MVNPKPTRLGYQTGPLHLHEGGLQGIVWFGSIAQAFRPFEEG
jgi:hypothetical protein